MTKRTEQKDLFLAALRGDAKAQRTCTKAGKPCGGRCIPKNWNCRIKGEGLTPPTRGNAVQLSPEQKEKVLKARSRRRTRRALSVIGGVAAVTAAVGGAAAFGAKNPAKARRLANKLGAGGASEALGVASAIGGPGAAGVAGVANLGVAGFQAGARLGAGVAQRRRALRVYRGLQRKQVTLTRGLKRLEARTGYWEGFVRRAEANLSAKEAVREAGMVGLGRRGKIQRGYNATNAPRSIGQTDRARVQNSLRAGKELRKANARLNLHTKNLNNHLADLAKVKKSLNANTWKLGKIKTGLESASNPIRNTFTSSLQASRSGFSSGRRQVSGFLRYKGTRGPRRNPLSWQEQRGLKRDEAERTDKKCGKSGIPDNAKCTKQTAKGSTSGGSGAPKNRSLLNRAVRTLTGASKQERIAKYEKEQAAREKKYGKHSPDANGGEALAPDAPLGRLLKKKGIDPNKIGGNSDLAIELAGQMEQFGKSPVPEKNFRFKSGTKIPKLPAQYLLRKDSAYAKREDKKCGNSGIPDNAKCTKKNTARTIAKVAATAALVAGGVAAVKSRSRIKSRFRKTGLTSYQSEQLKKMRAKGTGTYGAKSKRSFTAEQKPFYSEADRIYPVKHKRLFRDAEAADAEGKKYSKTVTDPKTGRKRTVKYGAKGYTIAPGTKRGNSYCARSFGDMKSHNKNCAGKDRNTPLCLSRAKWKCSGKTSR